MPFMARAIQVFPISQHNAEKKEKEKERENALTEWSLLFELVRGLGRFIHGIGLHRFFYFER